MSLPVYEMVINTDETSEIEVSFVALVDKPAIEKNFLAFNSAELKFSIDEEQRIISGPAMVANSLIYRRDEQGEYNVFFSKETIKDIAVKFFKKGYEKNVNLFHDPELKTEGVTIFESFVSDKERGIHPMKGFEDLPDGSWFISAKVDNEDIWNRVKSGELKGYSVEGIFSYVKRKFGLSGNSDEDRHLVEKGIMSDIKKLWEAFKEKFAGELNPAQLMESEYDLKDGRKATCDKLEAGGMMKIDGMPAPAGDYELADGKIVSVADGGVIANVTEMQQQQKPENNYQEQFDGINQKFAAYEQKFAEAEQKFAGYEKRIGEAEGKLNRANETIVSLMAIVQKIVETPTADPVDTSNKQFSSDKEQTKDERRKELAQLLTTLKKK